MPTHAAVATLSLKGPLGIIQTPTTKPNSNEILIRVEWTASTPLDLHQNDGGLMVTHPQILGDTSAGTVVEVGDDVKNLKVGDKVFGFAWREAKEKGQQEFVTAPGFLFGKVPEGFELHEAITLPNNFVTAWHSFVTDLDIELPWPKPEDYVPADRKDAILIWGGSSSVGQFTIQILKYYGYTNVIATASKRHHEKLRGYGATTLVDYNDKEVVEKMQSVGPIAKVLDCIGSLGNSMRPISKIVKSGAKVAILLPVVVRDSSETQDPVYAMDVKEGLDWEEGVRVRGVRTHFYLENTFHRDHLQSEIMPALLKQGVIVPNAQRIVEGKTLLERAQNALDALRRKEVSGERLVWRVSEA